MESSRRRFLLVAAVEKQLGIYDLQKFTPK
jgi:hypothetical protein